MLKRASRPKKGFFLFFSLICMQTQDIRFIREIRGRKKLLCELAFADEALAVGEEEAT